MKVLTKYLDIVDNINESLGKMIGYIILALMVVVVGQVVMRYFFHAPLIWSLETSGMMLLVITCLAGGYTLLHKGHVRVDIIYGRFSPKAQVIADLITYLVVFLICIVLVWQGSKITLSDIRSGAVFYSTWEYILWPSKLMIPIAGVFLGLQCLAKWIRDLIMVLTGVELKSKAYSGEGGLRG